MIKTTTINLNTETCREETQQEGKTCCLAMEIRHVTEATDSYAFIQSLAELKKG